MQIKGFTTYQTLGSEKGHRNIPDRITDYELLNYINKNSSVIDIGCNRGYFGIVLSDKIKSYIGIEHDNNELNFGKKEIKTRNIIHFSHIKN